MFKVDRVLIRVSYVTWVSASEREAAAGNLGKNEKKQAHVLVWSPFPMDDTTPAPEKMKPEEQGYMWAYADVIKRKPKGEVLAVVGAEMVMIGNEPLLLSGIVNTGTENLDTGLSPGLPGLPASISPIIRP